MWFLQDLPADDHVSSDSENHASSDSENHTSSDSENHASSDSDISDGDLPAMKKRQRRRFIPPIIVSSCMYI